MSLTGALHVGRSGLVASQAGIETAGNNLTNIGTRGYHRQTVGLAPAGRERIAQGIFVGRGVQIEQILRQVDGALEGRIRNGIADESGSKTRTELLEQIESLQNEFTDNDLSSRLSEFFNAWSELANNADDPSARTLIAQQAQSLATFTQSLRSDLSNVRGRVDDAIESAANAANDLLTQIDRINLKIYTVEGGGGVANDLRDQRDLLLGELSQYLDISVNEQPAGQVDVFVGSLPIVLNGKSRGVEINRDTGDPSAPVGLIISDDGSPLNPTAGEIGALLQGRQQDVVGAIDALDDFAGRLIFEVNRVHSQGQGTRGFESVTAEAEVADATVPLTDPAAGLAFEPGHGSFQLHVTQVSTGQRVTSVINIDLDGIAPATDTTLTSLTADIDAIANISATIGPDGRLQIDSAGGDFQVSFSDDTSGVLAALGINTFFSGSNAQDIGVAEAIRENPGVIAAGLEHLPGDNRTALAIAALRDETNPNLDGLSLTGYWNRHVEDYALRLNEAQQNQEADTLVRESLETEQQSISGVNIDEEAINLLTYQRSYQGSARFISVVDELMQTLLSLV